MANTGLIKISLLGISSLKATKQIVPNSNFFLLAGFFKLSLNLISKFKLLKALFILNFTFLFIFLYLVIYCLDYSLK